MARRLLERAREDRDQKIDKADFSLKLRQQHALCTYKDPDLPRHFALEKALDILDYEGDLDTTVNQETLGIAGAIFKRKWQVDARKTHLERSLAYYYERGHKPAAELRKRECAGENIDNLKDVGLNQVREGYTSINAAFVLDLLANIEETEAKETRSESAVAKRRRDQAREVREELVSTLPEIIEKSNKPGWWLMASLMEAYFGLGEYAIANQILEDAQNLDSPPKQWEFESTARQLAQLALIQRASSSNEPLESTEAWKTVLKLLDDDKEAACSLFVGKLGLALSGGGFRASLFHIGVLARLAEEDLLRHVHVLSCVSGGSIVGAHYYLEVRKLLQEKWDRDDEGRDLESVIKREDYIKLVERVAHDFFSGVESNLRIRVAGSLIGNLKMAFLPNYSRTDRLGELFEKEIFSKVKDGGSTKRYLDELLIQPRQDKSESDPSKSFQPKSENWKRRNKVPMLVLNATSLNTGHNWQFTSTYMGESPFSIDEKIDGNWRLRRMWYNQAPDEYRPPNEHRKESGKLRVRLGKAVGASACVPGLFEPVALPRLYPKDTESTRHKNLTVRLVDGGVHDNQGVTSLLEQDCDVLIVSDASGQMTSQSDPAGGVIGSVLRTNSVLMERVRQSQFQDLKARLRAGLLNGLMVLHLKKGLEVDPVDWKECEEPPDLPLRTHSDLLDHGILRNTQELLAGIRTDLDSFSEVEANALMTNGYLMAATYADKLIGFPRHEVDREERYEWSFLKIEEPLFTRGESRKVQEKIERMLEVASQPAFKIWSLSTPLKVVSWIFKIAILVGFLWLLCMRSDVVLLELMPPGGIEITIGWVGWAIVAVLITFLLRQSYAKVIGKTFIALVRWRETLFKMVRGLVMSTVGFAFAQIHIHVFDKLFLAVGRMKRTLKK
ncbi:MAG: patatin-like phospholipase family protein [Rhodothermales bacterium]